MDRNSIDWFGPLPALTTPFDTQGNIDETSFGDNVERLIAAGSTGFVVAGCTGEFWSLSAAERERFYKLAVEIVDGRVTVIVGTGAVTADETVRFTKMAEMAGVDGVLVLPPYFIKLTDDEIYAHYEEVSKRTEAPILLYNIPANAVNALSPDLVARLADIDNVVAVKESSGDWNNFYKTLIAAKDKIRVFCGPSSIYGVPAATLGADGFIDCFPNVWADGGRPLYDAAMAGDTGKAATLQATGRRLTDLFTSEGRTLYPATKAAMDMLGFPGGGTPRKPLQPLTGEQRTGLERGLAELGLL
ncbi:dihydrodipicolinate synthase family protein [Roseitalea porphyridii]|uniref:Dihydrodipicolinate synthase family protein n=1 Tax=Roseitalea porphyridii TaxID=1852022 RepID=A0A4P6V0Q0_9HYPH|nr:dihydrodipicolinate synthase family protein [Roseitalea porphyridii]QBK30891.1 dihydrodipicolinate synthase family protein [Roseitalea porphyridii]